MQTVKTQVPPGALLSANDRLNFHAEADRKQALVQIGMLALARHLQPVSCRQHIEITFCFPAADRAGRSAGNRRRDEANWAPTAKCLVDALVRGGVLPDDNVQWVLGPDCRIGPPSPRPNMVEIWLTLTDTAPAQIAEPKKRGEPKRVKLCSSPTKVNGGPVTYYCTEEPHGSEVKHRAVTSAGAVRW